MGNTHSGEGGFGQGNPQDKKDKDKVIRRSSAKQLHLSWRYALQRLLQFRHALNSNSLWTLPPVFPPFQFDIAPHTAIADTLGTLAVFDPRKLILY